MRGLSNRSIASELVLSPRTVENHISKTAGQDRLPKPHAVAALGSG